MGEDLSKFRAGLLSADRQFKGFRTQPAKKGSASETRGTNGVELQEVRFEVLKAVSKNTACHH
jgi:hypothetical protein